MTPPALRMTAPLAVVGSLVALGASVHNGRSTPATVTLRIESLSKQSVRVQVSSTPPGLWLDSASSAGAQQQLVVTTPSELMIADSVRTVGVTVLGFGYGAVSLHLEGGAAPQEQARVIWGRDITLTRGVDGQFRPVAKVFPLQP